MADSKCWSMGDYQWGIIYIDLIKGALLCETSAYSDMVDILYCVKALISTKKIIILLYGRMGNFDRSTVYSLMQC